MADLHYSHPHAQVVYVCDKPLDVPNDKKLWAWDSTTGELITSDDEGELRYRAHWADYLFEYDPDAPESSIEGLPVEWGLTCRKRAVSFPDASAMFFRPSSELFRNNAPCPTKVAEPVGRGDRSFMASPPSGKPSCDPPKKDPMRVYVCARPPGIGNDVDRWASRDVKGNLLTNSDKVFAEKVAKANIIFIFDKTAFPESVCWFTDDPSTLSCPDQRIPTSCNHAVLSELLWMNALPSRRSPSTGSPKNGDGQTTETSSPNGKDAPLNFAESIARNLMFAGAILSGNTSSPATQPNGKRYGMVGGKDAGGPDFLVLQAASGVFAVIGIPFKSGKDFIKSVIRAVNEGKVAAIVNPNVLSKEMAELLAKEPTAKEVEAAIKAWERGDRKALQEAVDSMESFGKAMAPSLRDAAVILPYSRAKIFTAGWEGKLQAHHLLEVDMADDVLGMEMKAIDDIPAIILSKEQHEFISAQLAKAQKELQRNVKPGDTPSPAQVWAMYQDVYKGYPSWLDAIKG